MPFITPYTKKQMSQTPHTLNLIEMDGSNASHIPKHHTEGKNFIPKPLTQVLTFWYGTTIPLHIWGMIAPGWGMVVPPFSERRLFLL